MLCDLICCGFIIIWCGLIIIYCGFIITCYEFMSICCGSIIICCRFIIYMLWIRVYYYMLWFHNYMCGIQIISLYKLYMIRSYTPYASSDMQFQRGGTKFYKYDFIYFALWSIFARKVSTKKEDYKRHMRKCVSNGIGVQPVLTTVTITEVHVQF